MRQILFGVYAEGSSDYEYFPTLLQRLMLELAHQKQIDVEILEPLLIPRKEKPGSFEEQMKAIEKADDYKGLHLIFVHIDADDPTTGKVVKTRWNPWIEKSEDPKRWIAVIPVKMLESWLLADWQALQSTLIVDEGSIKELIGGVNNAEQIESPKEKLNTLITTGKRRRLSRFRETLAVRAEFSALRRLPSFRILEQSVMDFLTRS